MHNRYIKFKGKMQLSKDECYIVQLSGRVKEIKRPGQFRRNRELYFGRWRVQ